MTGGKDSKGAGYGRPPEHTRFRKGQSGNPKGRPRGTKNFETDLREELGEKIPVREGDRYLRVSKQRAVIKALVSRALKGDARAAGQIIGLVAKHLGVAEDLSAATELSTQDRAALDRFVERYVSSQSENSHGDHEVSNSTHGTGDTE